MNEANLKDKKAADKKKKFKEFDVGDIVMAHFGKGRNPSGTYSTFQDRKLGSFGVLHKLGDNTYILNLSDDLNVLHI